MHKKEIIITKNDQETQEFGKKFASILRPGDVVLLSGELGSGKTTFIKGIALGLGVTSRIISPTFILVRSHTRLTNTAAIKTIYHLDLYRLEETSAIKTIGIEELFADHEAIVLIEWPEKIKELLPKRSFEINFTYVSDRERQIIIQ